MGRCVVRNTEKHALHLGGREAAEMRPNHLGTQEERDAIPGTVNGYLGLTI